MVLTAVTEFLTLAHESIRQTLGPIKIIKEKYGFSNFIIKKYSNSYME